MSEYRRPNYREDPRLNRQNAAGSPKSSNPSKSATNNGQPPSETWNTQTSGYNHSQALQNAYQSLPYHNATGHQYPTQTYYTGYQNYAYNPYENYQATQQAYITPAVEPRPPGEEYPHTSWTSSTNSYPRPASAYPTSVAATDKRKSDAVAEEKIKQLANLMKERETYEERVSSLKKKLKLLVEQKEGLSMKRSPDKDTLRIIKENTKLQVEIQSKMRDATNVIEILSNLIGDKKKAARTGDEPEKGGAKDALPADGKVNVKHYDPEVHWCRMCDAFPHSAKELLLHLHSKKHLEHAQEDIPWHKLPPEPKFPAYEGAPTKRVPIKGLQFFVSATAWYCRLCDAWIGDLHCASQHLMSMTHSENYSNFVQQNPQWEVEWMKDRDMALERVKRNADSDDDRKHKKKRDKYSPTTILGKEKKKKKRSKRRRKRSSDDSSSSTSSSSTSDEEKEDTSKSIRVAMRNKIKLLENDGKLEIIEKLVSQQAERAGEAPDDKLMTQWMTLSEPHDKDKRLLDNLKEKLKQKQDAEKAKLASEAELVRKQKEKEEAERRERERIALEMAREEERRERERMSLKLKDVKFKQDSHRRRSNTRSPERRRRRSRSLSANRRMHRNGQDRSPGDRYRRDSRSRDRDRERTHHGGYKSRSRSRDRRSPSRDKKSQFNRKLPFIGRMPLFKNMSRTKSKIEDEPPKREIKKEDYEPPRKTRFQPGNLARAFIPQPEVVCFPQLSSYPPIPPPPPPHIGVEVEAVETPSLSYAAPAAPAAAAETKEERALKEAAREEAPDVDEDSDKEEGGEFEAQQETFTDAENAGVSHAKTEDYMLYEDANNALFSSMEYNMVYPSAYNFMPVAAADGEPEPPKTHVMPLEPPPLPPDDPNEDLAMLGLSSDDMAVQQMF